MIDVAALRTAWSNGAEVRYHDPGEKWHGDKTSLKTALSDEGDFTVEGIDGVFEWVDSGRVDSDHDYWQVILKNGDQHFGFVGTYNSWNGIDMEYPEIDEVEKVERVISEWKTKR